MFQRTRVIVVSSKYTYVLILALYDIPNRSVLSPRVCLVYFVCLLRTVPYVILIDCARRARSKSSYSHPATHAGTHSHRPHSIVHIPHGRRARSRRRVERQNPTVHSERPFRFHDHHRSLVELGRASRGGLTEA